jgi:hypothetical protein
MKPLGAAIFASSGVFCVAIGQANFFVWMFGLLVTLVGFGLFLVMKDR